MYRVLYRKWRPKVFSDVIGQPQVTKTLVSQIRENRLSHAYLFTGSRGTGKTTCAKIFSKAINCLNPVDGNPCNECEICRGIENGTVLDIVEIDAASNRGIDDIRLLRDEANFTPSRATYRVYIIDEVHMLTIEAFNALLKTLEEPPEHVKFILATTEVHKLPATILSRCQRFDFRRIEPETIAARLVEIAKAEGAELFEDAATLIAKVADGGMRDALSLLDRCISSENTVTVDTVSKASGLMGREHIYALVDAIASKNTASALSILDDMHKASCDTQRLLSELIDCFRSFLIIKTVGKPENLIICTANELCTMKKAAENFTKEYILFALGILTSAADALNKTHNRRIEAEMALIRLCSPQNEMDISALLARISNLEKELSELKKSGAERSALNIGSEFKEEEPKTEKNENKVQKHSSDFSGFGEERAGSFSEKFSQASDDDEPFDFDAFMKEHSNKKSGNTPNAEPQEDVFPDFDDRDAPPVFEDEIFPPDIFPENTEAEKTDDNEIDSKTWLKIIYETERAFPPLIGMLTNSRAVIVGNTISIRLGDKALNLFASEEMIGRYVSRAAKQTLGKDYNIRLDK